MVKAITGVKSVCKAHLLCILWTFAFYFVVLHFTFCLQWTITFSIINLLFFDFHIIHLFIYLHIFPHGEHTKPHTPFLTNFIPPKLQVLTLHPCSSPLGTTFHSSPSLFTFININIHDSLSYISNMQHINTHSFTFLLNATYN